MTMTMNMPLRNCRQKACLLIGSHSHTRHMLLSVTVRHTPAASRPITCAAATRIPVPASSRQQVCRASVRTKACMPARRV